MRSQACSRGLRGCLGAPPGRVSRNGLHGGDGPRHGRALGPAGAGRHRELHAGQGVGRRHRRALFCDTDVHQQAPRPANPSLSKVWHMSDRQIISKYLCAGRCSAACQAGRFVRQRLQSSCARPISQALWLNAGRYAAASQAVVDILRHRSWPHPFCHTAELAEELRCWRR